MRVMVLVKATASSEAMVMPSLEMMKEMGKFNESLVEAGIMKSGDGLKPSSCGARVHFSGSQRTVTNGPFAETKELVAGFWMWEVDSLQHAIEWVKRCPNPMLEDSDIEIRPFFEMSDFAEFDPAGEVAAQEQQMVKTLAGQCLGLQPYLFFAGRCAEALDFYREALGAQVGMVMRFDQSPDPVPAGMLQPGFEHKVMHSEIKIGNLTVMASDGCDEHSKFGGFRLALSVPTASDADRYFDALAQEGVVDMPLGSTFWSPRYGMVTDRFGVAWMVMVPAASTQEPAR